MEKLQKYLVIGGAGIIVLLFLILLKTGSVTSTFGSVSQTGEYQSTTTVAATNSALVLKTSPGTLGSVIITSAATGYFTLYDATTTVPSQRAKATSSLTQLANFPVSAAVGTYTFDTSFYDGLIAVWTGNIASTSITYR
jgi:hypothetical protein